MTETSAAYPPAVVVNTTDAWTALEAIRERFPNIVITSWSREDIDEYATSFGENPEDALTDEQWEQVKDHIEDGAYDVVSRADVIPSAVSYALTGNPFV